MKKLRGKEKGITLIALVVTIVVLIILAAVSISMLTGENGIITQAQKAKEQTEIGKEKEIINVAFTSVKGAKIARGDMSDVTSAELQQEINNYTKDATVTGTGTLKITYTSGRKYEVDGNGKIVSSESYDGMYSVGNLEGKIAPQDLFEYEIIDEQAKTARILRIKPEYCNLEGYNPHTETYDFTNTNGDIIYNGEKISDMLVIPYEMEQSGIKYTITEANIMAENLVYIGSGTWQMYASYPSVDKLIYPNSIIIMSTPFNPYSSSYWNEFDAESVKSIVLSDNLKIIPEKAFYNGINLTSITIPDSVTYIGNEAFYGCTSLASITISGSIGESAFSGCTSLTNITILESVTSIERYAFKNCSSLTSMTMLEGVKSIESEAFYNCSNLANITIPDTVTSVGSSAFGGTLWYENQPDGDVYIGKVYYEYKGTMPSNTSVTIKEGTRGIADYAFDGCSNLTSITIPNGVTSIESGAFSRCTSLTNITIPNSVTSIGASAFYGCSSLTSITIPNSVTSIGGSAFYNCTGLTSVTLPDNITKIELQLFYYCTSLTDITIPNTVTSIDDNAFAGCSNLVNITIPDSVISVGYEVFDGTKWYENQPNGEVYAGKIFYRYKGEMPENTTITIKEGTVYITEYAFSHCTNLTSIILPDSVTIIGGRAFTFCSNLTSITMSKNLTRIEGHAFYQCTGLTSITLPDSVTHINQEAFYYCNNLTSINIKKEENSIPDAPWGAWNANVNWNYTGE